MSTALIQKLRYMARQYTAGSYARGGNPPTKHYLDEAADLLEQYHREASARCPDCGETTPAEIHTCSPQSSAIQKCKGMNCGATDGRAHSPECEAEHAAAIAGGRFVKEAPSVEPDAWMVRQQQIDHRGRFAEFGPWQQCSRRDAKHFATLEGVEVRPFYATPPDAEALKRRVAELEAALANSHNRHEYTTPPGMVFVSVEFFERAKASLAARKEG